MISLASSAVPLSNRARTIALAERMPLSTPATCVAPAGSCAAQSSRHTPCAVRPCAVRFCGGRRAAENRGQHRGHFRWRQIVIRIGKHARRIGRRGLVFRRQIAGAGDVMDVPLFDGELIFFAGRQRRPGNQPQISVGAENDFCFIAERRLQRTEHQPGEIGQRLLQLGGGRDLAQFVQRAAGLAAAIAA